MKYNPNIKNGNPNYFILDIGIHQQNNPNFSSDNKNATNETRTSLFQIVVGPCWRLPQGWTSQSQISRKDATLWDLELD